MSAAQVIGHEHAPVNLLAVTEAVPDAGAIVWWRLSGDVTLLALAAAWEAAGLPDVALPSLPGDAAALSHAVHSVAERRTLSRPLADGGRALVREHADGADLDYDVSLRARVSEGGVLTLDPPDHPDAATVRDAFNAARQNLGEGRVGGWLVRLVARVDGIRLRDGGGVYFVPATRVAEWRRMAGALMAAHPAHRVNLVPALRAEDAVAAVLDALSVEADATAVEMLEGVDDLTARRTEGRVARTEAMLAKVARYEALLGQMAGDVAGRLEALRGSLAAAALAKFAAEEEAGA